MLHFQTVNLKYLFLQVSAFPLLAKNISFHNGSDTKYQQCDNITATSVVSSRPSSSSEVVSGEAKKLQTNSFTLQTELPHFSWCYYLNINYMERQLSLLVDGFCIVCEFCMKWMLIEVIKALNPVLCFEMNNNPSAVTFVLSQHKSQ